MIHRSKAQIEGEGRMYWKLPVAIATSLVVLLGASNNATAVGVGQMCGGLIGIPCDRGLWCDPYPGQCGWADGLGTCVRVTQACNRRYDPVCGCNGRTYGNNCVRQSRKVPLNHVGRC